MFSYFASEGGGGGLLGALGVDARLFFEQLIAFLLLLLILRKFVYPALIKAVDKRQEQIDAAANEAAEAREALEKAESKADTLLADARKDAEAVMARGQQEAARAVSEAESKAKSRAEQIVSDARQQLDTDVQKARLALKKEAVQLVAAATEKVIGEKVDVAKDNALIEKSLKQGEVG